MLVIPSILQDNLGFVRTRFFIDLDEGASAQGSGQGDASDVLDRERERKKERKKDILTSSKANIGP